MLHVPWIFPDAQGQLIPQSLVRSGRISDSFEMFVAMETRVPIRPSPKPNAAFPHPNDASDKIWLNLACRLLRYSCLKVLTDAQTDAQTGTQKDDGSTPHPISSPMTHMIKASNGPDFDIH